MKRMHNPGDERRSLAIVPPAQYAHCPEQARSFLTNYPASFGLAVPAQTKPKEAAPVQGGLFDV